MAINLDHTGSFDITLRSDPSGKLLINDVQTVTTEDISVSLTDITEISYDNVNNRLLIGDSSSSTASNFILIGDSITVDPGYATDSVAIGQGLTYTSGINNVLLGANITNSADFTVVIGENATSSGMNGITIGRNSTVQSASSIVIGTSATSTAANQLVIGSASSNITNAYIGKGVVNSSPVDVTINATGGSGTNIVGGNLTIAAGKSTGSALPGNIIFQQPTSTTSGTTLQSLIEVGRFNNDHNLDIANGLIIGSLSGADIAGAIQWSGTNFQGYNGSTWINLDATDATTLDGLDSTAFAQVNGATFTGPITTEELSNHLLVRRNLTKYYEGSSTLSGTVKITLPYSWTSTMHHIIIRGYQYSSIGSWELHVGGYDYAGTGTWNNCNAILIGNAPFDTVRFGHDGTKTCILLGNTATAWSYPNIVVEADYTSFSGSSNAWTIGWSASRITDETGITVTQTHTVREPPSIRHANTWGSAQTFSAGISLNASDITFTGGNGIYGGVGATTARIWAYSTGNPGHGIYYTEGANDEIRLDVSGQAQTGTPDFSVLANEARVNGNTVWHAGNATLHKLWVAKTSAYTAVNGDQILADSTSAAFTITLPASPSIGYMVTVVDAGGNAATNNITIGRNGQNIQGVAENLILDVSTATVKLVFYNASRGWVTIQS